MYNNVLTRPKKTYIEQQTHHTNYLSIPKLLYTGIPVLLTKFVSEHLFCESLFYFFTQNGYTYMKIGQWLSSRNDILSAKNCARLSMLHKNAPVHSLQETYEILRKDFDNVQYFTYNKNDQKFAFTGYAANTGYADYDGCIVIAVDLGTRVCTSIFDKICCNKKKNAFANMTNALLRTSSKIDMTHVVEQKTNSSYLARLRIPNLTNSRTLYIYNDVIGSGCVAQTYKAKLRTNFGTSDVAVKILHPNIQDKIQKDMNLLKTIAKYIDINLFAQFETDIKNQIDMQVEHKNLAILRNNFAGFAGVKIPKPICSTKNVLVMEYVPSTSIQKRPNTNDKLVYLLQKIAVKMVVKDRFVHCDLHPGNVALTTNNKVVLYDAGMCRYLHDKEYKNLMDLLYEILYKKDYKSAAKLIVTRNQQNTRQQNKARMQNNNVIDAFADELGDAMKTKNYAKAMFVLQKYNVKLDYNYSTLLVSGFCLDGLLRRLSKQPYNDFAKTMLLNVPLKYVLQKMMQ